jgi:hypothetical protein
LFFIFRRAGGSIFRFLSFGSFDQVKEYDNISFVTFSLMKKDPKNQEYPNRTFPHATPCLRRIFLPARNERNAKK